MLLLLTKPFLAFKLLISLSYFDFATSSKLPFSWTALSSSGKLSYENFNCFNCWSNEVGAKSDKFAIWSIDIVVNKKLLNPVLPVDFITLSALL